MVIELVAALATLLTPLPPSDSRPYCGRWVYAHNGYALMVTLGPGGDYAAEMNAAGCRWRGAWGVSRRGLEVEERLVGHTDGDGDADAGSRRYLFVPVKIGPGRLVLRAYCTTPGGEPIGDGAVVEWRRAAGQGFP